MLLLIWISVTGFVLSAVIHFCWLFRIYESPSWLLNLINISAMVVLCLAYPISKKTQGELSRKDYRKALSGVCPGWLAAMGGFLIMYALGGLLFSVYKRHFADSADFRGFTGHWMALYALAFIILYSVRRLKKQAGSGACAGI